jgi:hypothetical protein
VGNKENINLKIGLKLVQLSSSGKHIVKLFLNKIYESCLSALKGRHDTQHNDIQHNDTQHQGVICIHKAF